MCYDSETWYELFVNIQHLYHTFDYDTVGDSFYAFSISSHMSHGFGQLFFRSLFFNLIILSGKPIVMDSQELDFDRPVHIFHLRC